MSKNSDAMILAMKISNAQVKYKDIAAGVKKELLTHGVKEDRLNYAIAEHILGNLEEAGKQYRQCSEEGIDPYLALAGLTMVWQQRGLHELYKKWVDYDKFPVVFADSELDLQGLYIFVTNHKSMKHEIHPEAPANKYITGNWDQKDCPVELLSLIIEIDKKIKVIQDTTEDTDYIAFLLLQDYLKCVQL